MQTTAVVLEKPETLGLARFDLMPAGVADVVVEIAWSGISTGTERLLWSGRMPHFPGMGYPLVPGYESVGRVVDAGSEARARIGEHVFVPGANCFGPVRGLFGGAASHLVVPQSRVTRIDESLGERGVLLALAATAHHAIAPARLPDLIVGHGALGRLLARIVVALGGAPVVHETRADRRDSDGQYAVLDPANDTRRDYGAICDVSGDASILDLLVMRLAPGGEITLAGFYAERLGFSFPPAFMREARFRIAAQWQPADLAAVRTLIDDGKLSLDGLISHRAPAADAPAAYRTAFTDPACLKLILDWSSR